VRALYWKRPSAAALADTGLTADDFPKPEVALWPDNEPPIRLFSRISGQWRTGPHGPIALDYNVVFHELDRLKVEDYDDMLEAMRIIEGVALDEMNNG
jgi:hypothetical protein